MKLNNHKKQAGLTLIEITLVIAVLLGLISVLFIGVSAYKEGADRSKCILNLSNAQKAVRSYQNLYSKRVGDTVDAATELFGTGLFIESTPACPDPTGSYSFGTTIPAAGTAFATCDLASTKDHKTDTAGW